ncbi:GNAT family N-acetyltransferase [Natronosalvus halobius]|uniref:GNAT family N-acetyltransferase n=1 Tax=Natronosalvus halobius TaxID=2953746 RepID=UPI00209F4BF1|nr:GNAT family N-acetyltransferase [Natronosalvus halobius]USZ73087.1 GNAT family N-acetyltransferase [Natronosalvus halobius]
MSHLFPDAIETDRLLLERLSGGTVDPLAYYRICGLDPAIGDVTRYTPWDPHETPGETLEFLASREGAWNESRSADYVIRPRVDEDEEGTSDIAGTCGLGVDWTKRTGDLGIWLRERFWGRGYSGERADALVTLAFEHLDLEVVSVLVQADNERSLRACDRYVERLGGTRNCRLRNWWTMAVDEPTDAIRYTITRASYDPSSRRSMVSLEASR